MATSTTRRKASTPRKAEMHARSLAEASAKYGDLDAEGRREVIAKLRSKGHTFRAIGEALGISKQAAHQALDKFLDDDMKRRREQGSERRTAEHLLAIEKIIDLSFTQAELCEDCSSMKFNFLDSAARRIQELIALERQAGIVQSGPDEIHKICEEIDSLSPAELYAKAHLLAMELDRMKDPHGRSNLSSQGRRSKPEGSGNRKAKGGSVFEASTPAKAAKRRTSAAASNTCNEEPLNESPLHVPRQSPARTNVGEPASKTLRANR